MIAYINTNVITPYNAAVAATNYPTQMSIGLEFPDDPSVKLTTPSIVIEPPIDLHDQESSGLGDQIVYKYKQFRLYCFPAITTEGKPSWSAAATMKNYMDWALGTGLYIPIMDYTPQTPVQSEAGQIIQSKIINSSKSFAPLLAIEKHRFDYLLTLKIPVTTING